MKTKLFISGVLTLALSAASLYSSAVMRRIDLLGNPAPPTAASRTIVITPNTQYVNVKQDEIVRFVVGDKTFAWNFNVPVTVSSFELNRVIPTGVLTHPVTAYIEPLPMNNNY